MALSDELRRQAEPVWRAEMEHPFVTGIGDGSLPLRRFQYWIRQDYLFLIEYCRVFAMGAAKAPDLPTMRRFQQLLNETLNTEMDLHRRYADSYGISEQELESETMAPTTRAYTQHLLSSAQAGALVDLVAALLPCMWGFAEIGQRLQTTGDTSADNPYASWIEMYASEEFAALGDWCRDLLDALAEGLGASHKERLAERFITSSRYEYLFWDMAWNEEVWPV